MQRHDGRRGQRRSRPPRREGSLLLPGSQNESSWPAFCVCFHKGDNRTGDKFCRPLEEGQPVLNLSGDFNGQVRSVSSNREWACSRLRLWEHYGAGGQRIEVVSDENLVNRPILVELPFGWRRWSDVVSSYQFLRYPF